jgi:hypothetical protein
MSPPWHHLSNLASSASPLQPHLFSDNGISNGSTSGGGMSHNITSDGAMSDNSTGDGGVSDDVASLTSPLQHHLFNLTSSTSPLQPRLFTDSGTSNHGMSNDCMSDNMRQ